MTTTTNQTASDQHDAATYAARRDVDHAYMDQLLAKVDQLTTDLETAHLELSMATATADALREQLHPTKPAATTTDVDLWADQS